MARCPTYHWQFMIVLQDGSLPSVWEEFHSLSPLQQDNEKQQNWGDREQAFRWVNHIRYEFGANAKHHITVHLVVCNEQWQAVDENAQLITKTSKHAWLSSRPLHRHNVHARCNLAGRYRWGIEIARSKSATIKRIIESKRYQEVFPTVRLLKNVTSNEY